MFDNDLYSRDAELIASPSKMRFYPLAATGGKGPFLTAADGRQILDATSGQGAFGLGYGNPRIAEALSKSLLNGDGANILAMTNASAIGLADRLLELIPGTPGRKVYLGLSGSDANTAVIRSARKLTERPGVLSFSGSYHGGIGDSQAISGFNAAGGGAVDPNMVELPYPDLYRPRTGNREPQQLP